MKRALYILGVFLVSLLLVSSMLVGVLMSGPVQTSAVQWATEQFASALGTEAHIGEVKYHFPARVSIHDIYVEDLNHDTLLYVDELFVHFHPWALAHNELKFSHVHIDQAVVKLYERDGEWNYRFFLDGLGVGKSSGGGEPSGALISVRDIQLDSIRVHYQDYQALLPHASMDLNELQMSEPSLDAQIDRLALHIQHMTDETVTPFDIEEMSAHLIYNDSLFSMPTLKASLPKSHMDMSGIEIRLPVDDSVSLGQNAHDVAFAVHFHEAEIVPAELSLFVPKVKGMKRPITLSGGIGGTLDSLCCQDISMQYNGRPFLQGDVCAVGLPDLEHTYLSADVKDIQTNAARLQDFLSQLNNRPTQLPPLVHRLGDIHYHGSLEGRVHDLTLHGGFRTAVGSISTDGTLVSDSNFAHWAYEVRVEGRNFRLGRMLDQKKIGNVTAGFYMKGRKDEDSISGNIDAHLKQFTYDGYTFNELRINGHYEPQLYNGRFSIEDPHMNLAFDGMVNLQDKDPEINFNLLCRHFDLAPFSHNNDPLVETSFSLAMDMNGAQADEISGYLVIDSLALATQYDSTLIRQVTLVTASESDMSKMMTLHSDNLSMQVDGVFRYADLVPSCQSMLHHYLPSLISEPSRSWKPVQLSLRAEGGRLREVQRLFEAPLTISDHTTISADIALSPSRKNQSTSPMVDMRFFAPGLRVKGTPVHDLTMSLKTIDTVRYAADKSEELAFAISAEVNKTRLGFSTIAFRDTLLSHVLFERDAQHPDSVIDGLKGKEKFNAQVAAQRDGLYQGDIPFITHFSKYNKKPLVELHFLPDTFILRDSVYTISDSYLTYAAAETVLQIEHFFLEGAGQHIRANGLASKRSTDTLSIGLQQIDAAYVVPFVLPQQIIMFNGLMTGEAEITGVFGQPFVESMIHVDSMGLNNCYFGEAEVDLHVYPTRHLRDTVLPAELRFHADVSRPDRRVVGLDGEANFAVGSWNLDMDVDSVPLDFINHWTHSVLDNLDGHGSGKVIVGGTKKGVYVLLKTLAHDASLTIPWTGARYTIAHDSILMDTTSIIFPNVHLADAFGNKLEIDGSIHHKAFESYLLDLHIDSHDALVFDSNVPGDMIQGSVFASGHVDVTGPATDILVDANARTAKNSKFRLSLDNASSAYESNFIHFVQHPSKDTVIIVETDLDNIDNQQYHRARVLDPYPRNGRCMLKLNIDLNPHLLFQLVIGERNGDMIKARGNGALSLTYDTKTSDVLLLGTYNMDQGSLSYTVANVIRKEFTVGAGSTIVFSGNAADPQLDVTAKYRVSANLKDLFGDEVSQLATTRTTIPVLTCLHMTGLLSNPLLNFSLEFPMSDQAIQQQVRQAINTDEMLMRQVIYLLVFGRFMTPDYMNNAQYATLNSTYSLLSSTVTGQINAWLSKLTNMLTLGVAIRTDGEGADRSQEYEANFQLQPVDRLVINGNFGYRYNDISNQPFFGDLDVEVLLTEDGQLRLKGYTHTVDKYSLRQASTIQGVGLMWKKDF